MRGGRAAPRAGAALLAGLVVCGHCGRQMHVAYRARPAYVCTALQKVQGQPGCLHLDGPPIDAAVVEAFFTAIAPAELAVLEAALADQHADHARLAQQHADQAARAEYEAHLAARQYRAVDPDNRLVAAELERRWEVALRVLAEARETAERFAQRPPEPALDPAVRAHLADLGTQLPALWQSGRLQPEQQKVLLRSLIRRVHLTRPIPARIDVRIVWVSGAVTPLTLNPPTYRTTELGDDEPLASRVVALSQEGQPDRVIADRLTAEGFRSARHGPVSAGLVGKIRRARGAVGVRQQFRSQEHIGEAWTIHGLAQHLGVRRTWLYDQIRAGVLPARRHRVTGHYLIPADPAILATLRAKRPAS